VEQFDVEGQQIQYVVHGVGDPVLTVANPIGGTQSLERWPNPFVPILTDAGYQVIVFQHLGPQPSAVTDIARDIGALLDDLKCGPARLWGYSLGGTLALELAHQRPDAVRATAVMATTGRRSAFMRLWFDAFAAIEGSGDDVAPVFAYLTMAGSMSPSVLANDDAVNMMRQMMRPGMFKSDGVEILWSDDDDNRLETYAGISGPCCVIAFERDLIALQPFVRELADTIPESRYVEITEVGHDGINLKTDEVMKHLLEFFSSV
jgi:pimeloyl-ACP methyl ester carboxylesterase